MKKSTSKLNLSIIILFAVLAGTFKGYSQETGHYVPGLAGIKGATLPPPGFYYIMHNVYYTSDSYRGADGSEAPLDFNVNVFSNAHRFVYIWEDVLFGANYAVNMIVPLVSTDISMGAMNIDNYKFGVGDIIMEPFVLSWNKKKYDIAFGLAAIAPTGSYDVTEPASPGKSWWSGMLTLGGTYYFDSNKSWHASVVSRYEMHNSKKDFDITAGNDLTLEWGLGKTIPKKVIWSVGASGYAHWQVTEDSGTDIMYDPSVKDRVFSVGPEVTCFIPPAKLNIELRGHYEFGAIDRSQGQVAVLSLFKAF